MSAEKIKHHYGSFVEIASKQGVVHTSHGRKTLVTISFEQFKILANAVSAEKPEYKKVLQGQYVQNSGASLLDFAGSGVVHSTFKSAYEVDDFITNLRNEWN
jgi:hypothetical protein